MERAGVRVPWDDRDLRRRRSGDLTLVRHGDRVVPQDRFRFSQWRQHSTDAGSDSGSGSFSFIRLLTSQVAYELDAVTAS
ncbi:MAG: hypothetical protein ACR2OU_05015, partial [Thermomicrobiales bacterium]